jgi:GNAT superfamily N-acetyltransferase
MTLRWRQMAGSDLDAVERIAGIVHPGFFERREVLAEKQGLYPAGAWLCEDSGEVSGYFFTHPWHSDAIPALDAMLGAIPLDAGTYYFHDLALMPEARGRGAAREAVAIAMAHASASGFRSVSLVTVNGSQQFWISMGFEMVEVSHLCETLAAYESGARYMTRTL